MDRLESIKSTVRSISGNISEDDKIVTFMTMSSSLVQRTIVANLAAMYSQSNVKTIIVDLDFSQDSIAKAFKINKRVGLSDYLSNHILTESDIVSDTEIGSLKIISSGTVDVTETSYLSSSPRFKMMLKELSKSFDFILINTPVINNKQDYIELRKVLMLSNGVIFVSKIPDRRKLKMYSLFRKINRDGIKMIGYINAKE